MTQRDRLRRNGQTPVQQPPKRIWLHSCLCTSSLPPPSAALPRSLAALILLSRIAPHRMFAHLCARLRRAALLLRAPLQTINAVLPHSRIAPLAPSHLLASPGSHATLIVSPCRKLLASAQQPILPRSYHQTTKSTDRRANSQRSDRESTRPLLFFPSPLPSPLMQMWNSLLSLHPCPRCPRHFTESKSLHKHLLVRHGVLVREERASESSGA